MGGAWIGSEEHKAILCRVFAETHVPFDARMIEWPGLDAQARQTLAALPIWDEALRMEASTALAVQTMAARETDTELSRAIELQGYEEGRHAELLRGLITRYGLEAAEPSPPVPPDPEWSFLRIGYAECFDSFFAFGLFALARDSRVFPPALASLFEPVVQEEARHILFHVNWVAYRQARQSYAERPAYLFRRALAVWLQVASRIKTALRPRASREQDNFTMRAHAAFGALSPRGFIELCLAENERRLKPYDERLLRPAFVPRVARALLPALPA